MIARQKWQSNRGDTLWQNMQKGLMLRAQPGDATCVDKYGDTYRLICAV